MVDTLVSGASASRRVGSTPIIRTRGQLRWKMSPFFVLSIVTTKNYSIFVMEEFSEREMELIAAIRNYKNSKHNESKQLKDYAIELFDEMLND